MRNAFNESMREVGAPLADFWENDLELGLEDILRRLNTNGHLAEWADGLNGRTAALFGKLLKWGWHSSFQPHIILNKQVKVIQAEDQYKQQCA